MAERFAIRVAADAADLARAVGEELQALAAAADEMTLFVALSGGSTPKGLYQLLARPPLVEAVRWDRFEFFFSDERAVPPDHPESNYGMVHGALLSKVKGVAHRMRAESGAAEDYERLVMERVSERRGGVPVLDLVLLGMGDDGHTASLFPGTSALRERKRLVVMNEVPRLKTRRMTFTYPLINAARRVWVLAPGVAKRDIVARCLVAREQNGCQEQFPVVGARPTDGELIWWLDRASAGDGR